MTDDLQIPEFLIRRGVPRLTNEQAHALNEARRNWVKPERRIKERPSVNAYLFERPELPVVVGVRRGDGSRTHLARYDNFAAFAAAKARGVCTHGWIEGPPGPADRPTTIATCLDCGQTWPTVEEAYAANRAAIDNL